MDQSPDQSSLFMRTMSWTIENDSVTTYMWFSSSSDVFYLTLSVERAHGSHKIFPILQNAIMTRKRFENTHDEALSRLCFVCGEIINMDVYFYEVEKCLELLSAAFKCPGIFSIPGVTPHHICRKCHRTLEDVASGVIIKTGKELLDWAECSTDCETCAKLLKRKIVRGRPKKVSQ